MRFDRGGVVAAGLALSLGLVTAACGDDGGEPSTAPTAATTSASGSTQPAPSRPDGRALDGKTIALDPGHNGKNGANASKIARKVQIGNGSKECDTTGTSTNDGYSEAAFTWDVTQRLAKILRGQGAKIVLTREDNDGWGPCIDQRAGIGNKAKADAALSVHADGAAASSHGFHVIEPGPVRGMPASVVRASNELGRDVRDAFERDSGFTPSNYIGDDGIDRRTDLGGLNLSTVPKVFVECGNMRNAGDAAKMTSAQGRQRIAEALAKGLGNYLRG
ncbi:N-acetylmuramoyl-L-alanine amidase [Actinomadura flavalba]|uniref:N-acetylmuramoyl-L-alanine amidase n=1 Tax=Actinomadura flavalba TaxID=1120938 RepID=UPI0003AA68E8|nr:N-acetylmuramoyl-L-alanine amidase [Actinomadura flavalba]